MILHPDITFLTDQPLLIRYQLEIRETIEALRTEDPRQGTDTYDGHKDLDHGGIPNYVIGHGHDQDPDGAVAEWGSPEQLAAHLFQRGIQSGDVLCIITCRAGRKDGAADFLTQNLNTLRIPDVTIRAPVDYIHWNANGAVLVTRYPRPTDANYSDFGQFINPWNRVLDAAWKYHQKMLKLTVIGALNDSINNHVDEVHNLIHEFVDKRPIRKANFSDRVTEVVGKSIPDRRDAYANIIHQAREESDGASSVHMAVRGTFARDLGALLVDLHSLLDPANGVANAAEVMRPYREVFYNKMEAGWKAYSPFFDVLRTRASDMGIASQWETYKTSPPPAVIDEVEPEAEADTPPANQNLTYEDILADLQALETGQQGDAPLEP
jgi:hypothetical protein